MTEKRRSIRFGLDADVAWKRRSAEDVEDTVHLTKIRDLSTGGASLVFESPLSVGDLITLEVRLDEERTFRAEARVAWVTNRAWIKGWVVPFCEGGVEFLSLNEAESRIIDRALQRFQQS